MKDGFGRKKNRFKEFRNICPKNKIPPVKRVKYHRRSEKKKG